MVLTSFKIFQKEVDFGRTAPYLEDIELSYRENFLSFKFAALNFQRPDKNLYLYKLDGLDTNWVNAGPQRFTSYTNLSPGAYVFQVKASNNDGVWNEEGARVRIVITPPPWATWWAYTLYVSAVLAIIGGYLRAHRRKIERERAINRRLRKVDRLKDEFLAKTSHELRTPLYGVIGLVESLLNGARGVSLETMKNDLRMVVASGRRLAHLVNDILDFSKLRHESLELRNRPVDVRSVTDVVLTLSQPLVATAELELNNAVPADLPPVTADEDRLQQILHNLIGNAIKFTERGSVEVAADVEDGRLVIRVIDTGIGIAEEAQARIFDAFEQADASTERTYGGTGLGLAVTRQLVELHGGEIWLRSSPGQGTTFFFTLPIAAEQAEPPPVKTCPAPVSAVIEPASEEPPPDEVLAEGECRVLVVDDDPVIRQVLINHLGVAGYRLQQAARAAPRPCVCLRSGNSTWCCSMS